MTWRLGKIDSTGLFVCGGGYIITGLFHGDWIGMVNGSDRNFQSSALADSTIVVSCKGKLGIDSQFYDFYER
jgi:hypothetical protein